MNSALRIAACTSLACLAFIAAAAQRDGATIVNSGSTNFSGYTIKVWSDGSTWAVHSRRGGPAIDQPVRGSVAPQLAAQFLSDLKTAKHSGQIVSHACVKSASFGSSTVVQYHGWQTPDLLCPGDGFVVSIAADANKIVAALKMTGLSTHRVPMLPNERRRPPV